MTPSGSGLDIGDFFSWHDWSRNCHSYLADRLWKSAGVHPAGHAISQRSTTASAASCSSALEGPRSSRTRRCRRLRAVGRDRRSHGSLPGQHPRRSPLRGIPPRHEHGGRGGAPDPGSRRRAPGARRRDRCVVTSAALQDGSATGPDDRRMTRKHATADSSTVPADMDSAGGGRRSKSGVCCSRTATRAGVTSSRRSRPVRIAAQTQWQPSNRQGKGRVYSWIVVHMPLHPAFEPTMRRIRSSPLNSTEGVRSSAASRPGGHEIVAGAPLTACFYEVSGRTLGRLRAEQASRWELTGRAAMLADLVTSRERRAAVPRRRSVGLDC